MNNLFAYGSSLVTRLFQNDLTPCFMQTVRNKARKASAINRNKKQAKGQHYCIKYGEGAYVRKYWTLCTQPRLRYHGGLNVGTCNRFTLMSLAEGKVVITCEKPDLNWEHPWNQKYYAGREGVTFYKKYLHIIPRDLPIRFKVIDQV